MREALRLGIAAGAALAVLLYLQHVKDTDPTGTPTPTTTAEVRP